MTRESSWDLPHPPTPPPTTIARGEYSGRGTEVRQKRGAMGERDTYEKEKIEEGKEKQTELRQKIMKGEKRQR